jgi:hypothetical protein
MAWVPTFILVRVSGVIFPVFVESSHICAESGVEVTKILPTAAGVIGLLVLLLHVANNKPNNNSRGRKMYLLFIGHSFIYFLIKLKLN